MLQTARSLKAEVQRETKIKESVVEKTKERWHGKRMHGKLPRNLDEKLVDIEQSYRRLKSGDINPLAPDFFLILAHSVYKM